ncbi:rCG48026 [Rattus norvegicus]|uniref:RCG48026 n=1 Tax=Rattus norvegicus TaxID=10116 RepID=A6HX16_RAT|nr:rCG48026 [Rattus norvegicus]
MMLCPSLYFSIPEIHQDYSRTWQISLCASC